MTFRKAFARTALAATILAAGSAFAQNSMVGGAEMFADKPIAENAVNAPNLTTLVAAVKAAGLVETLAGEGPFTVFAPDNAAFEKLPAGTVEELLKPENKDKLTAILTYHVVPAKATSDAAMGMIKDDGGMHPAPTVNGEKITLKMDGDKIVVVDANGGEATVTQADVMQSNGVVACHRHGAHAEDVVRFPLRRTARTAGSPGRPFLWGWRF